MSIALTFQRPTYANDAATAPHPPSSQTFVRAASQFQRQSCGVQQNLCSKRMPSMGNEDGIQCGVLCGQSGRGHAAVDALMHLLAPALIPPPISTSPHVATL